MKNSSETISINPSTGLEIGRFRYDSDSSLEDKLSRASKASLMWRETSLSDRLRPLGPLAEGFRKSADRLAKLISVEMGKPISQARAEIEKCASLCDWHVAHAAEYLKDEELEPSSGKAFVRYRPLGTVLAVMPWNFPFWQVMRAGGAILVCGNPLILKPASNVLGCARELEELFRSAGFPLGVFTHVHMDHGQTEKVIRDARVAAVTVTGGVKSGSAISSIAASCVKKSVLELGGSDAFVVLRSADIEKVAREATKARFENTGQICISAKRFIVEDEVYDSFLEAFFESVRALKMGNPLVEGFDLGPMARADLREELLLQVRKSLSEGAKLICGGAFSREASLADGFYFSPTILSEVLPEMTAFREETFGPLASVTRARDAEHALALANESEFGLSGSIWHGVEDQTRVEKMIHGFESGSVFINRVPVTHPAVPVGGIKKSGFGRELAGFGYREFVNAQTVWFDS